MVRSNCETGYSYTVSCATPPPFWCCMGMPSNRVRRTRPGRRGFTMLELLVVISILIIAFLVFATFLGPGSIGPSLERSAKAIRSMVTNVRQNASVRKVHSELVLDYKNDRIVALARRRLATFAFEGDNWSVGSGNLIALPEGDAGVAASRGLMLRDGQALDLPDSQSRLVVPWVEQFDFAGDYQGMAVSFDYFPRAGVTGNLCTMGSVFTISVSEARRNAVKLTLSCGGVTVTSNSWCVLYRWMTVEIAVSRYGVTLYVDGRLNEGVVPDGFEVAPAAGNNLRLGGVPCRIDNFEMNSLVSSQEYQLDGVQFIAPGVDPELEGNMRAEHIYDWKPEADEGIDGPITQSDSDTTQPVGPTTGLPLDPPPAIVHVYFDPSGKLDPAKHAGAVLVYLMSWDSSEITRMELMIHPLGAVTWEYLDLFPWEEDPEAPPGEPS